MLAKCGSSSRFYRKLLKEQRLFSEIDCYQAGYLGPSLVVIEGKPAENVTLEQAEAAIWTELELISNEIMTEKELQKLKNRAESQQIFGDAGAASKATNLAFYELMGEPNLINTEIEAYNNINTADIQRVARHIFRKDNSAVLFYKAQKP